MDREILIAGSVFLIIDTIALIILLFSKLHDNSKKNKIAHFGDMAEEKVSDYLEESFPSSKIFNHVLIKTDNGTTEIDHILISRWGLYVIETKSHNGKIVIGDKDWVQYYKDKIIKFLSPLLQNEAHIKAIERILKKNRSTSNIKVRGLVVFTSNKVYFSGKAKSVIKLDKLNLTVKHGVSSRRFSPLTVQPGKKYLSRNKIEEIAKIIEENIDTSKNSRKRHVKLIESNTKRY